MAEAWWLKATPPNAPDAGYITIYAKTDGFMYAKNDDGTERALSTSGINQSTALTIASLRP